ncbi:nucleotidyltransferase [Clostridium oryzae]|uniref:tRNA(Met) cytidine acetate ligase n=1 Tax=Clostridium oryzae TaxID=1450648 RepID=A0A1V4IP16_9CLOT|nr:nucleotidyltransferase [Clostridium oryzae]OPJ61771.1 hypothetical protein CLORY_20770 [Clostridium oryzae]
MIISAIISEYNPLHNGHKYQIEKTKELTNCSGLICIMSGNFVQRGEPALIDKWNRTLMALKSGVDLVLELPSLYSLSSAEYFANAAVSILNSLSIVNYLSFGSELGEVKTLNKIASVLFDEPIEFKANIKKYIKAGYDFPTARALTVQNYFSEDPKTNYNEILNNPNNILGIEYCKALIKCKSTIEPFTIRRVGGSYNSLALSDTFSSASAIRHNLMNNDDLNSLLSHLPEGSSNTMKELKQSNYNFIFSKDMFSYIKYKLITDSSKDILNILDCNNDLLNRMMNFIGNSSSLDDFIKKVKTKGYTYTRISRILAQYFIGFEKYSLDSVTKLPIEYIRVLGLNSIGAEILKRIKNTSSIRIYTKLPKYITDPLLDMDVLSTNAYSILNDKISYKQDYIKSPIII